MQIQCRIEMTVHNKNGSLEEAMNEIQDYFTQKQMCNSPMVEIGQNTSIEDFSVEDLIGDV